MSALSHHHILATFVEAADPFPLRTHVHILCTCLVLQCYSSEVGLGYPTINLSPRKGHLQAAQDGERLVGRGLAHVHRLEAPLQRGVALQILAELGQRGRANDLRPRRAA